MNRGLCAVVVATVIGAGAPSATAALSDPGGHAHAHARRATAAAAGVSYGDGPVMHSELVHLVFWQPSGSGLTFDAGYIAQIETFIARVAADSRSDTSLFGLMGQYGDSSGPATYQTRAAAPIIDTGALPTDLASTCTEPLAPPLGTGPPGWNACVSDTGIQNELQALIHADRLPTGLGDMYIVLTPKGFGSCFDTGPMDCALGGDSSSATPGYCGYHSEVANPTILYALIPYNAVNGHCQSDNPRPNASTADPAISTVAHEFAETVTDPLGSAWSDAAGDEIADLCLTNFGPNLGGSSGSTAYDEVIGAGHYYIQELWSNQSRGCAAAPKPDAILISAPRRVAGDRRVTFAAAASDPQGQVIGYRWAFGDGRSATGASVAHAFLRTGTFAVTLRITDSWDNWAYATRRITVSRPPRPVVRVLSRAGARVRFGSDAAVATFTCSVDHGRARVCRSPYTVRGLGAGPHAVWIRARDSFGQLGGATRYAFTVS